MKTRILSLLLVLIMAVGMLASCGGGGTPCSKHVDKNGDGKCDTCSTAFTCQHKDNDHNLKCDDCQAPVECQHVIDEEGFCEYCDYVKCVKHVDRNHDLVCDNSGCDEAVACVNHADRNVDNKCDWCTVAFTCPLLAAGKDHEDGNQDGACDECFFITETFNFPWLTTGGANLTFEMTENSNGQELPSGCKNWMAGETTGSASMTEQAAAERNENMFLSTKISVTYKYLPDNDSSYGWGANYNRIQTEQGKGNYYDMYCNFVYDLMGASLLGCFANLKTSTFDYDKDGTPDNYFEFYGVEDYGATVGDTTGYMYEYMTSLSIDERKMYLLASDYFIDLIRAYYCIPVDVAMLEDLASKDVLGLGRANTISDFVDAIEDGKWTYELLLKYCAQYGDSTVGSEKKGFAIAQHSLSAAGLLYTSSVRFFTDERKDPNSDFVHNPEAENSPYHYADENATLEAFANALDAMVRSSGVVRFTKNDKLSLGSNLLAIRQQFSEHKVLFGGVILLGSLEYKDYQDMKTDGGRGFLVVPVPLYTDYDEATNNVYSTQVHNVGRIGAISQKTKKFVECSAFLDYQSTHSRSVRDTYYNYDLLYSVVGGSDTEILNANKAMLDLLRDSVITGFDKAYEDSSALFSPNDQVNLGTEGVDKFINLKWHDIFDKGDYQRASSIRTYYTALKPAKENCMKKLFNSGYTMLPE